MFYLHLSHALIGIFFITDVGRLDLDMQSNWKNKYINIMNKYIINIKWNKFEYKFVDVFFNAIAKIQGFNSHIQQKLYL